MRKTEVSSHLTPIDFYHNVYEYQLLILNNVPSSPLPFSSCFFTITPSAF
jgi:hypothetical protein